MRNFFCHPRARGTPGWRSRDCPSRPQPRTSLAPCLRPRSIRLPAPWRLLSSHSRVLTNGLIGYIATDARGQALVFCDDELLVAGCYFYSVGNHDAPKFDFGIVTEFEAWVFPTGATPAHWSHLRSKQELGALSQQYGTSASGMSTAVQINNKHCIVTKYLRQCCMYLISPFR